MVRKVHGELCTELGRPCSATDLSRALHNLLHSIDADIKLHGACGESRNKNKYPIKNHNRGKVNSYSSYGINTATTLTPSPTAPMRTNALSARERQRSTSGLRRKIPSSTPMSSRGGTRRGPSRGGPRRQMKITGCSLCGYKNHQTTDCQNMRNAAGKVIRVHPVQVTCGLCPGSRKDTLHHPPTLCPFKANGFLHGR